MSIGFRVYTKRHLPPQEIIAAYRALPAANVGDCMNRFAALPPDIRLMSRPFAGSVAGAALTVKVRAGDNLMIHKALDLATEGDVLVVHNSGDRSRALYGAVLHGYATFRKVAAVVLDGPMRDVEQIRDMGPPVYATGATPCGPHKDGPGEINGPVAIGGVSIHPGDVVLGDVDGVVVIPRQDAAALLPVVQKFSLNDRAKLRAAREGTLDRSWVDRSLREKGCEIIDAPWE